MSCCKGIWGYVPEAVVSYEVGCSSTYEWPIRDAASSVEDTSGATVVCTPVAEERTEDVCVALWWDIPQYCTHVGIRREPMWWYAEKTLVVVMPLLGMF